MHARRSVPLLFHYLPAQRPWCWFRVRKNNIVSICFLLHSFSVSTAVFYFSCSRTGFARHTSIPPLSTASLLHNHGRSAYKIHSSALSVPPTLHLLRLDLSLWQNLATDSRSCCLTSAAISSPCAHRVNHRMFSTPRRTSPTHFQNYATPGALGFNLFGYRIWTSYGCEALRQ